MRIVKITPSQKVKERYYLDLEDGTKLKINLNLIADYSLFTGKDLPEEEVTALRKESSTAEIRARALRMTGARAMSRKEVTDKLVQKGAEREDADATAEWLEKMGVVNDAEYAGMIARHYTARGYGIGRVREELYRRGVPKEYWDEALEEISGADSKLDTLVAQKLRSTEITDKEVKKLTASLLRRGFSWSEVKAALERYEVSLEGTDDE